MSVRGWYLSDVRRRTSGRFLTQCREEMPEFGELSFQGVLLTAGFFVFGVHGVRSSRQIALKLQPSGLDPRVKSLRGRNHGRRRRYQGLLGSANGSFAWGRILRG